MKKIVLLAMVVGFFVSGCGGYLVEKKKDGWANSWDLTNVDREKFKIDHEECCTYTKHMINTPFMDGLGAIPSDFYYNRCMRAKGYGQTQMTKNQTTKPQVPLPQSSTTTVVTVTWTSANIRSGAGDEFPVLTTVNRGERLTIIGERGEWFNIRLEDGTEGWINSRALK